MQLLQSLFPPFSLSFCSFAWWVSDALGDLDGSIAGSVHDVEVVVEEQKDDGKLGFCEIQWQQKPPFEDGRKFTKKNFKRLDETPDGTKLNMPKIDEAEDDRVQIISLTSPMKVRSPLGYRSSFNIGDNPNESTVVKKVAPVHSAAANIKTFTQSLPPPDTSHDNTRKSSLLSLKSLSMSLRLLKKGTRSDSLETVEPTMLETIDETTSRGIFKLDIFERNLKKFVSKSNEADFQNYAEYSQNQQHIKTKPKTYFKNQKVYARRSSMSDVHENNPNQKPLQKSTVSSSSHSVKHEAKKNKEEHKKTVDKTAEMLKEVRKRNLETSKRISAPRRISTAY